MLSDIVDVGRNVNESNANWEYIDTSIAAMGTIAHAQLDIEKIQERATSFIKRNQRYAGCCPFTAYSTAWQKTA
ncbi:hypothetical protein [Budvicia aquatica]|uniref:hypothetical protein n=1 Tax=Budvicia aquatica TaxID=82979 RepID=UPI00141BAC62|nr:hypothetical protein [Budvicia aquatica]